MNEPKIARKFRYTDGTLKPVKWRIKRERRDPDYKAFETIVGTFYVKPIRKSGLLDRAIKWTYGKEGDKEPMGEHKKMSWAQALIEEHYKKEVERL